MRTWIVKHTSVLVFFVVVGLGFVLVPSIGVSWDEPDNIYAGGVYWNFFVQGGDPRVFEQANIPTSSYFGNTIYSQNTDLHRYPPVPNYVGTAISAIARSAGWGNTAVAIMRSFHWATVLFFALLTVTVFRFGRLLGLNYGASLFGALGALFYPTLFGYGFSNLKDTAQAAMFTLTLYYLVRAELVASKKDLLVGGALWGLALATKFNAIYVPIIWGLWFLVLGKRRAMPVRVLTVVAIGLVTSFLVWPYLWFDPVGRSLSVIRYFTSVGEGFAIFWNGQLFHVGIGQPLWWYPWANLVVVTPLPILILSIIGTVAVGFGLLRGKKLHSVLLIWLVVPFLRAMLPRAAFYDGLRHFLEVLPAVILLAAEGLDIFARQWRKTATVVAVVTIGYLIFVNITLFPYSSGYYNELARNANTNFDRDIEALSVGEAMDWLHNRYGAVRVWARIGGHLAWYWVRSGDTYVYGPETADFIILVNKSSHITRPDFEKYIGPAFRLDHVVSRSDAILAWIYKRT